MQKLDPKAKWLFTLRAIGYIFGFPILLTPLWLSLLFENDISYNASPQLDLSIAFSITLFVVIGLIIAWLYGILSYQYYYYEIKPEGFRKESGIIIKKYTTIPYAKIQNVDIVRGLLARILGLSQLKIQTAGYSANNSAISEGLLPGLSKEVAEILRDELVHKSITQKN